MGYLDGVSIKAKNYKCFGGQEQGFEHIHPINLIIGRNNSGKSALLDLVGFAIDQDGIQKSAKQGHKNNSPEFFLIKKLTEPNISAVFDKDSSGSGFPGTYYDYGMRWLDKPIKFKLHGDQNKEFISVDPSFDLSTAVEKFGTHLSKSTPNPFGGRTFKRILADRDIKSEMSDSNLDVSPDGKGVTNLIQTFFNKESLRKRSVVEKDFLNDLNFIFSPDSTFKRIFPLQLDGGGWEIFLEEENKGAIKLSDSGSGLKTVILVLVNMILLPALEGRSISNYIFAFEELENNLHPGLLRRLFMYIIERVLVNESYVFITTHSSAVIDLISKHEQAQIVHVKNDGDNSIVKQISTYVDNNGILEDLDIRASDLLQSNGLVWVEGPSDRTYVNKWISIWSDGLLKEGIHYQCVFYGGRLLAHLQANPENISQKVEILNINRNAFLVIDSDKDNLRSRINSTKNRLIEEIKKGGGTSWVTQGREIENYIPFELIQKKYASNRIFDFKRFDKIETLLNSIKKGEGDRYLNKKVVFAETIVDIFNKENIENNRLDLADRLTELCATIRSWNKLI